MKKIKREVIDLILMCLCAGVFGWALALVARPWQWQFWVLFAAFIGYNQFAMHAFQIRSRELMHRLLDDLYNSFLREIEERSKVKTKRGKK